MRNGSRVMIWKQDPCVPHQGRRLSYLHTPVEDGPKDPYFEVLLDDVGTIVEQDLNGDFLIELDDENLLFFDAVHTFTVATVNTVASQVRTMYQRALFRAGIRQPLSWRWQGDERLKLKIHLNSSAPVSPDYNRIDRTITLPSFDGPRRCDLRIEPRPVDTLTGLQGLFARLGNSFRPKTHALLAQEGDTVRIHTCQSFDLVAHETGHAIFDGLKPRLIDSAVTPNFDVETQALWESCGDLSAIFTLLAQMDQCEALISHSKGNLRTKTFFSAIAERYGFIARDRPVGLRNADNDLTADLELPAHEKSQVLTGAIYDILVDIYNDELDVGRYDPAETLFRAGRHVTMLFICAVLEGPEERMHFDHVARQMLELERNACWRRLIQAQFMRRKIL